MTSDVHRLQFCIVLYEFNGINIPMFVRTDWILTLNATPKIFKGRRDPLALVEYLHGAVRDPRSEFCTRIPSKAEILNSPPP